MSKLNKKFILILNHLNLIINFLDKTERKHRVLILMFIDSLNIIITYLISLFLFSNDLKNSISSYLIFYLPLVLIISLTIYFFTGQYKPLTRYFSSQSFYYLFYRNLCLVFSLQIILNFNKGFILRNNFFIVFFILLTSFITFVRFFLRDLIQNFPTNNRQNKKKVVIYGAGAAGAQLYAAIRLEKTYKVLAFIDDNPKLTGHTISSIPIYTKNLLDKKKEDIDNIILAIPTLSKIRKKLILSSLKNYNIPILKIPSIKEIAEEEQKIKELKPITIEDLLGRVEVNANYEIINEVVKDKVFLVTGAAGSIGSELCNQIIKNNPAKLIILDQSEIDLYNQFNNLKNIKLSKNKILPILGSASNSSLLKYIFETYKIDTVFHAAAYKHVPLLEINPLSAIRNNIFSTKAICDVCLENNIENVVLISSDKAVRPKNIMGASKRISELIFQSYDQRSRNIKINTKFSMVRFGNVLNSSGSVVPLFKKQIASGGPITLTHKRITRFFMTIPEAASLVLQASGLAKGGEVFLLDMGKPMLIKDLAEAMITLSGLSRRDESKPDGDIEIIYTGLRPGEKLYEELLINSESNPTENSLIFKSKEPFIDYDKLSIILEELELYLDKNNMDKILETILFLVPNAGFESFYPNDLDIDHL